MNPNSLVLQGRIVRQTEKALFIAFKNGRESWVPKSTVYSAYNSNSEKLQEFTIAQWLLEKNNILLNATNINVIGESGSETFLKSRLMKKGLDGFESFSDIQHFKKHFKSILKTSTDEERKKLTTIIETLRSNEDALIKDIEERKHKLQASLAKEKQELLEGELTSEDQKRLKKIDRLLEKKIDKPFKKDKKRVKRTEKEIATREKKLEKSVEKSVKGLHKAHDIINQNRAFVYGAVGETTAIKELRKLPEQYYILNEARLSFYRAIHWKKYGEYVKSCKIDHVVVGPPGVFLIETKNWSAQTLARAKFTPHKQVERAGYIFFIHMINKFRTRFPTYQIVATYRKLPELPYRYVDQMTIRDVVNFILQKRKMLTPTEIQKIVEWLRKGPYISNFKFKGLKLPFRLKF